MDRICRQGRLSIRRISSSSERKHLNLSTLRQTVLTVSILYGHVLHSVKVLFHRETIAMNEVYEPQPGISIS